VSLLPFSWHDFQGRIWVTREHPWVYRLVSAWLIQRFIDSTARILCMADPFKRLVKSLGVDFDGAVTHLGHRVTFELLMASCGLNVPGLARLAALVRCLDVGGLRSAEAVGLAAASMVLDGLLVGFSSASEA
jgi:hypothetical protein